ncbi:MAG: alkyl hydroperoxide reductase [Gemmatimonadetes bacterium]|nr:alkyl hydroperoxide reductase [Gemmatimonadota bacterium]
MRKLEEELAAELVVVGVHSGKFIAERVTENIRQAAWRLGVGHPLVNDRQFRVWRSYAVRAWPTIVLLDPEGYVAAQQAGEVPAAALAAAVRRIAEAAAERGTLDPEPRAFPADADRADRPLRYPGKVAVDVGDGRLYIADTGHDRIVVARLAADGRAADVEAVLGGGAGFADGPAAEARFRGPQGLATADGWLYVADTGNHAVRAVRIGAWTVETLAGTGQQARRYPPVGGPARETALNSPWDVLPLDGRLYVAMAGAHQLWRVDLERETAEPWVGSGAEELLDGPGRTAALAQPSGLATDGRRLFFADSEASAIRSASLPEGDVATIVGTGLFDFGDRDGAGDAVRLQHPLGVCAARDRLYVADTYNGALKVVDPVLRTSATLLANELWEPGGLATDGERLYVADTNHHRIVVVDLATTEAGPLELRGL